MQETSGRNCIIELEVAWLFFLLRGKHFYLGSTWAETFWKMQAEKKRFTGASFALDMASTYQPYRMAKTTKYK